MRVHINTKKKKMSETAQYESLQLECLVISQF
jgi:hypothetical protein